MANRSEIARPRKSREFQPGADGVGRNHLFAAPSSLHRLSRIPRVPHAQCSADAQAIFAAEKGGGPLRSPLPERLNLPGKATRRYFAHAGDVGIATNRERRWSCALANAAALDHSHRFSDNCQQNSGKANRRGAVGIQATACPDAADRVSAKNPAGCKRHLSCRQEHHEVA